MPRSQKPSASALDLFEQSEAFTTPDVLEGDIEMTEIDTTGVRPGGGGFIANPPADTDVLPADWQGDYEPFVAGENLGGNIPELDMPDFGGPGPGPAPDVVSVLTEADSFVGSDGLPFVAGSTQAPVSVPLAQNLTQVEEYERIVNPQYMQELADEIELIELRKGVDAFTAFHMVEDAPRAEIGDIDEPELRAEIDQMYGDYEPTAAEIEALYGDGPDALQALEDAIGPQDGPLEIVSDEAFQDILDGFGEPEDAAPVGVAGIDRRVREPEEPLGGLRERDINDPITELDLAFLEEHGDPAFDAVPGDHVGTGYDPGAPLDARPWYQRWFQNRPKEAPTEMGVEMEPLLPEQAAQQGPTPLGPDEDARVMPFSERPSANEFEVPELGRDQIEAFNDVIEAFGEQGVTSNASIASDLGIGVAADGGWWIQRATMKDWLVKQGKGLLLAAPVAALTMWLNSVSPDLGDYFSLSLVGLDLVTTGDPFGMLLYGVGQVWDMENISRQKVLDNDNPDSQYGSRLGYVREGDKWYPAVYNKRYKSTGKGAGDSEMTMSYGEHVVYFLNGEGQWMPGFAGQKNKDFAVLDSELDESRTTNPSFNIDYQNDSLEALKREQPTRDWYFLSKEDAKAVIAGEKEWVPYEDDVTTYNPVEREMNDWRKALDYGQDYKWSSAVDAIGDDATVNTYMGSRGLTRTLRENGFTGFTTRGSQDMRSQAPGFFGIGRKYWWSTSSSYEDYKIRSQQGNTEISKDIWDTTRRPAGTYIMNDVLHDHLEALYRTQREAAEEAHFDTLYTKHAEVGDYAQPADDGRSQTAWSSMYLDTGKDFELARDADTLQQQLQEIELMTDRTAKQRNYLAQKVQTRYWMQQVSDMGGTSQLYDYLYGRNDERRTMTLAGLRDYKSSIKLDTDEYHDWNADELDSVSGWVPPWQNSGEGMLPDLARTDGATTTSLLQSDYRTGYDQQSAKALVSAKDWINRTSGYDPNLVLNGVHRLLGDRDINDKAWTPIPDDFDPAAEMQDLSDEATALQSAIEEMRADRSYREEMRKLGQQGMGIYAPGASTGEYSGELGLKTYGSIEELEAALQRVQARKALVEARAQAMQKALLDFGAPGEFADAQAAVSGWNPKYVADGRHYEYSVRAGLGLGPRYGTPKYRTRFGLGERTGATTLDEVAKAASDRKQKQKEKQAFIKNNYRWLGQGLGPKEKHASETLDQLRARASQAMADTAAMTLIAETGETLYDPTDRHDPHFWNAETNQPFDFAVWDDTFSHAYIHSTDSSPFRNTKAEAAQIQADADAAAQAKAVADAAVAQKAAAGIDAGDEHGRAADPDADAGAAAAYAEKHAAKEALIRARVQSRKEARHDKEEAAIAERDAAIANRYRRKQEAEDRYRADWLKKIDYRHAAYANAMLRADWLEGDYLTKTRRYELEERQKMQWNREENPDAYEKERQDLNRQRILDNPELFWELRPDLFPDFVPPGETQDLRHLRPELFEEAAAEDVAEDEDADAAEEDVAETEDVPLEPPQALAEPVKAALPSGWTDIPHRASPLYRSPQGFYFDPYEYTSEELLTIDDKARRYNEQDEREKQAVLDAVQLAKEEYQRHMDQKQAENAARIAAIPDPYENSHGFLEVPPASQAVSMPALSDEDFVPMGPEYRSWIHAQEAQAPVKTAHVKVI